MSDALSKFERQRELKLRTKSFAVRILKMFKTLPRSPEAQVVGRQLLRSATSVAANYRSVCRSRSNREFASKLNVVLEEADESQFWIEMLIEGEIVSLRKLRNLLREADKLVSIFTAALSTMRQRLSDERNGECRTRKSSSNR